MREDFSLKAASQPNPKRKGKFIKSVVNESDEILDNVYVNKRFVALKTKADDVAIATKTTTEARESIDNIQVTPILHEAMVE